MVDHTIIKKLIEREERYMNDAAERQDAEDAQFYKIRKQAFEEVEPFFRQLLDENEALTDYNGWEEERYALQKEAIQLQADKAAAVEALQEIKHDGSHELIKLNDAVKIAKSAIERLEGSEMRPMTEDERKLHREGLKRLFKPTGRNIYELESGDKEA